MTLIKTLTILTRRKLQIAPIPQWRYYLNSSHIIFRHIISVNMSALPHYQVGDKQVWNYNRDYMIFEYATHVNIYVILGEEWWNVGRTQQVLLYSSVDKDIAHTAVQLQRNDRFSNCVLLYWLYKLYCSGRLGEVHRGNGCSYRNGATVALSAEQCGVQYSGRLLFYLSQINCLTQSAVWLQILWRWRNQLSATVQVSLYTHSFMYINVGHISGLCLHSGSCNQLSHTFQVSVYTAVHVTNFHTHFRSLSTQRFM